MIDVDTITEAARHLLVGVATAWVLAITLLCVLYAFGMRFWR